MDPPQILAWIPCLPDGVVRPDGSWESAARILAWVAVGLIFGQAALVAVYVRFLSRFRQSMLADSSCPRAAVVLCVRGLDPFLPACLAGLFSQDYPNYDVWIVVDSTRDPAWPVVSAVAQKSGKRGIHILTLTERLTTCTRKLASIVQALANVDGSYGIVAFLDSDTIPHATWLRELAAPLSDPRVGVSSGNRWYMPAELSAGSLVRYLWNAAAVVQMYCYGIAWGGSLAIQGEFLRRSDLRQRLANGFSDDTTICRAALAGGYRIAFSPSLVMVNRETCSVRGVFGFLQRQLLAVRLHNSWWGAVVGHGVITTAVTGFSFLLAATAAATAHWSAATWAGATLIAYWAAMMLMALPLELSARRVVQARGETIKGYGPWGWLRIALTIPLAQVVHCAALAIAFFARSHRWRGVQYQFRRPAVVQVVNDQAEAA